MEKVREIVREGRRVEKEDPRRVVHAFKVGLALASVSSFYYFQPSLLASNFDTLAHFLQEFGDEYFEATEDGDIKEVEKRRRILRDIKVFSTQKVMKKALANFSKWEPRHGQFRFRHPWKQYLAVGALVRLCAYRFDALSSYINSDFQIPVDIKRKLEEPLRRMSSELGKSMKEMSISIKKMTKSSSFDIHVLNSQSACKALSTLFKSSILNDVEPLQIISVLTTVSLLIDIVNVAEKISESVHELASIAKFNNKKKPNVLFEKSDSRSITRPSMLRFESC